MGLLHELDHEETSEWLQLSDVKKKKLRSCFHKNGNYFDQLSYLHIYSQILSVTKRTLITEWDYQITIQSIQKQNSKSLPLKGF